MKIKSNPSPELDREIVELTLDITNSFMNSKWIKTDKNILYSGIELEDKIVICLWIHLNQVLSDVSYNVHGHIDMPEYPKEDGDVYDIHYMAGECKNQREIIEDDRFLCVITHEIVHLLDAYRLGKAFNTSNMNNNKKYLRHGIEKNARVLSALTILYMLQKGYDYSDSKIIKMLNNFIKNKILVKQDSKSFISRAAMLRAYLPD